MSNDTNEISTPGGAVGARVGRLISDAVIHTKQKLAQTQADVAHEVFTRATNQISDEVRAALGPIFRRIADDPETPPELKPLLSHLANTRGQAWGWIGGAAAGAAVGSTVLRLVDNWLNPIISGIISLTPSLNLAPGLAAAAAAKGLMSYEESGREIRFSGIGKGREGIMQLLAEEHVSPGEILELLRRKQIEHPTAMELMHRNGIGEAEAGMFLTLASTPLTPEQAAAGWARSLVTDAQVRSSAASVGLSAQGADVLMGLAGEPPPMDAAILAWRRGIIDESDVDRAIIQGPIRNEWISVVKALAEEPLPVEQAASAVTQGHLTEGQGAAKAQLSGVSPADFKVMVDNAGLPPGLEFAAEAFNRGLITDEDYTRMFLESRIKNKYVPLMKAMRENLPPAETARIAYRLKVAPREWALKVLAGHGLSADDSEVMLALEDARAKEGTKDLTRAQILDLFGEDVIEETQASDMLHGLGFDDDETRLMILLEEGQKVKRFVNALETRVRNAFVSGNIDEEEAAQLLTRAGVGTRRRDNLITLWDLERESLSASLTASQIVGAIKKGLVSRAEGKDRLIARGYTEQDAEILIRLTVTDSA